MMTLRNTFQAIATSSGKPFDVVTIDGDNFIVETPNGIRKFHRSKFKIDPRTASKVIDGRVEVDLELIDLNYRPSVTTPSWEPTTSVKPYEQLTKLYIDIETTGLDPLVDRVLMVGLMAETGVKIIITETAERVILSSTIEHLRSSKPNCLIGQT